VLIEESGEPSQNSARKSPGSLFLQVFPSVMLPMFMAMADQTMVSTALPAVAASLGDVEQISWIVVSYLVATTIAAPVYGRLGDKFGRRRLMLVALLIAMSASLMCALARSVEFLIVCRVLQGLGGGGLMTLSQALIAETVPPRERARYQGYLAAVGVSSSTFGPVVGGALSQYLGWQFVFLVNLPIGLVATLLVMRLPARAVPPDKPWRFDWVGLILFATFITSTLLGLGQIRHLSSEALLLGSAFAAASIVSLFFLLLQERRSSTPLLPIILFREPSIWRSDSLAACHGATLISLIAFMPIYFYVVKGVSAAQSGLLLLPLTAGVGVGSLLTGRMMSRTGQAAIFPSCGLTIVSLHMLVFAFWGQHIDTTILPVALGVIGMCLGTVMGVVQVTVQIAAGPNMLGAAAGSVQFSRSVGAAFGTATVGAVLFSAIALNDLDSARLFSHFLESGPHILESLSGPHKSSFQADVRNAFGSAFLAVAAFSGIGAIMAWLIPLRRI
jgi:EmrB/QacA subfamily drug resistance transporter